MLEKSYYIGCFHNCDEFATSSRLRSCQRCSSFLLLTLSHHQRHSKQRECAASQLPSLEYNNPRYKVNFFAQSHNTGLKLKTASIITFEISSAISVEKFELKFLLVTIACSSYIADTSLVAFFIIIQFLKYSNSSANSFVAMFWLLKSKQQQHHRWARLMINGIFLFSIHTIKAK